MTIGSKFGQEIFKCKQGLCKDHLPQQKKYQYLHRSSSCLNLDEFRDQVSQALGDPTQKSSQ